MANWKKNYISASSLRMAYQADVRSPFGSRNADSTVPPTIQQPRLNHTTIAIHKPQPATQKQFNLNHIKEGAMVSVHSPLQAKCRASPTQRSRSRVTFVIFPATTSPREIPVSAALVNRQTKKTLWHQARRS